MTRGFARVPESNDMQRMLPTDERPSRNYLDETIFWILAQENERQAARAHNSPLTRCVRSSNTQFRARGFAVRNHCPLIRFGSL
jgi:hypothetical protein